MLNASFIAALMAPEAEGVELLYTWNLGEHHRFRYQDATIFSMAGSLGESVPPLRFGTETIFSETVLSVAADGSATVNLTVESLAIQIEGRTIATLAELPDDVCEFEAQVDRRGNVSFTRRVTAWLSNDTVYLTTGHEAETRAGWRVFTTVDAHTGRITRRVATGMRLPEDAMPVETLPVDLFEMLMLPEGDLDRGETQHFSVPGLDITTTLNTVTGAVADLSLKVGTSLGAAVAMGAQAVGLPDESGADSEANLNVAFDTRAGRLLSVGGNFTLKAGLGDMGGVTIDSALSLVRL